MASSRRPRSWSPTPCAPSRTARYRAGRPAVYPPPHPTPRTSAPRCDLAQHLLPDQLDGATRESIGRYLGGGGAAWTLAKHTAEAAQLLRQLMRLITLEGGGGPGGPGSGVGGAGGAGGAGGGRGGAWACKATGARSSSDPVVASSALYAAG